MRTRMWMRTLHHSPSSELANESTSPRNSRSLRTEVGMGNSWMAPAGAGCRLHWLCAPRNPVQRLRTCILKDWWGYRGRWGVATPAAGDLCALPAMHWRPASHRCMRSKLVRHVTPGLYIAGMSGQRCGARRASGRTQRGQKGLWPLSWECRLVP